MKTKLIYFSDQQIKRIQKDADDHEISFTEMVRRILDFYYEFNCTMLLDKKVNKEPKNG